MFMEPSERAIISTRIYEREFSDPDDESTKDIKDENF